MNNLFTNLAYDFSRQTNYTSYCSSILVSAWNKSDLDQFDWDQLSQFNKNNGLIDGTVGSFLIQQGFVEKQRILYRGFSDRDILDGTAALDFHKHLDRVESFFDLSIEANLLSFFMCADNFASYDNNAQNQLSLGIFVPTTNLGLTGNAGKSISVGRVILNFSVQNFLV